MPTNPPKDIAVIILKSTYTTLTGEEQEKLSHYLNASAANRAKYQELIDAEQLKKKLVHYARKDENKDLHFQSILKQVNKKAPVYPINWFQKYSWAAALVLLLLTGTWLLTTIARQDHNQSGTTTASVQQDVLPGKEGAILTLGDGSKLSLDSMNQGVVATQPGAQIKLQDGQLAYDAGSAGKGNLVYNTLSTPKGREFQVVLPDGTHAWLNSYSSIRYPVQFDEHERVVYITGEVYFEVAPLVSKGSKRKTPFLVKVSTPTGDAGTIEVLGTHFNINAYEDRARTTLLEGSVKVNVTSPNHSNKDHVILKPGQQAQVTVLNKNITTITADVDKVMAWRRGFFNFDDASLEEVMQQLALWYDIDVEYKGVRPPIIFGGELSRGMKLSGVLKALEESGVHFKLENRKIIVLP